MSKLNIKMYLKSEKSELKPIILKISFGYKETDVLNGKTKYKPLYYNSGVKIKEEKWNAEINLPSDRQEIATLLELEGIVKNTYENLRLKNVEITPSLLGSELDKLLGRKSEDIETIRICDFIEKHIETNGKRSLNTRKQYKNLKNHLLEYEKKKNSILTTKNFQRSEYLEFMGIIKNQMNTANSVWKIEKNLKATLNEIRREFKVPVFNPREELSTREKTQLVDEDQIYLTYQQTQQLIDFKPDNDKYKNVKLILLTLLFTGCRYSDVFKVNFDNSCEEDHVNFKYARFITDKGKGTEVIVPILSPLINAYQMNGWKTPTQISNQKFNEYVKDLMEYAKFTDEVKLAYTDSHGNKVFKTKKMYELVTSHIGRRSFITNLINYIPITTLCKITGHKLKDRSIIFKYNKIGLLDNAKIFMTELKRVSESNPNEFPIPLVLPSPS
ncbi:MAG: hypothetical protein GQ574_04060 [Crocinitomix sp.]|nr:hypothetical protein [Crocinitomix sp.]